MIEAGGVLSVTKQLVCLLPSVFEGRQLSHGESPASELQATGRIILFHDYNCGANLFSTDKPASCLTEKTMT